MDLAVSSFNAKCSSLDCLRRLPISTLGVSQSFIVAVRTGRHGSSVIRAVVALDGQLKLSTVTRKMRARPRRTRLRDLNYRLTRNC